MNVFKEIHVESDIIKREILESIKEMACSNNISIDNIESINDKAYTNLRIVQNSFREFNIKYPSIYNELIPEAILNVNPDSKRDLNSSSILNNYRLTVYREPLQGYVKSVKHVRKIESYVYHSRIKNIWSKSMIIILEQFHPLKTYKGQMSMDSIATGDFHWIPIIGMKCKESLCYDKHITSRFRDRSLAYIEWIDTSGFCIPGKLQGLFTRAMIRGYYSSLSKHPQVFKIGYIALFASGNMDISEHSQRSLFFIGSEKNPTKHKLTEHRLRRWWMDVFIEARVPRVYVYSPNGEWNIEEQMRQNTRVVYGLPFTKMDRLDDVMNVVPRFPDDPMSRHLGIVKEKICLKDWLETLEMRKEYLNGYGAHFYIDLGLRDRDIISTKTHIIKSLESSNKYNLLTRPVKISKILRILGKKPCTSVDEAKEYSKTITRVFKRNTLSLHSAACFRFINNIHIEKSLDKNKEPESLEPRVFDLSVRPTNT